MARPFKTPVNTFLLLPLIWLMCGHENSSSAEPVLSTPCQRMNTIWEDNLGDMGFGWGYGSSRLWYAGEKVWFSLGEPSEGEPQKIFLVIRETPESPSAVVAEADFPGTVSYTLESHQFIDELEVWVDWTQPGPKATLLDAGCDPTGDPQPFPISLGINDAWYVPDMSGHGVLLTVYPSIKQIFLALFTFDTEGYSEISSAILGDGGQRWLTAMGLYSGSTAHLDVDLTVGGVFLEAEPKPQWLRGGTINLQLNHCNSVTLDYDIPSISRQGTLQLQRVAADRMELCELLSVSDHE